MAGGCNTIFGFLIYCICLFFEIPVWFALLISMLFGTAFNFLTISHAFRELTFSRIPSFITCYFIIYIINLIFVLTLSKWTNNEILSQIIILLPMAILSYYLMNNYVFVIKNK